MSTTTTEPDRGIEQPVVPAEPARASDRLTSLVGRVVRAWPGRLWPISLLIALVAFVAIFTNSPAWYIGDVHFEHVQSPARLLAHHFFLWDQTRGLGRVRGEWWPAPVIFAAVARGVGFSPGITEHLWHAALLAISGIGMVALLRVFRPRIGAEHFIAAMLYAFNPFTATYLIPSVLFVNYALAPWLLLVFARGVRSPRPWRSAAGFAVLVWLAGTFNPPALLYGALPIIPLALYLVVVERSVRWRQVFGWSARALLLTAGASAAAAVRIVLGSAALAENLAGTEGAKTVNFASSWAESWRGLGFWLSYVSDARGLVRPQDTDYFVSWIVVLGTFAAPLTAMVTLWRSRWRPRLAFMAMALLALVLMVGSYPSDHSTPFGKLLLAGYQHSPTLFALRNSYKAGPGLMIGIAALVGVGIVPLVKRVDATALQRATPAALCLILIPLTAFPFFDGHLYSPTVRMRGVPSYWNQAASWIDHQPVPGRVMILPGYTTTISRWGSPGDDIFDALLSRPHVVRSFLPLSGPEAANLVAALDDGIEAGHYRPGSFGPIARRLGISLLVIRNDLDWKTLGLPRPSALASLRTDPDLVRQVTFGAPGQNVTAKDDRSLFAISESKLPPVEVYAVRGSSEDPARALAALPPIIVDGDAASWNQLALHGDLSTWGPVRYAANLTPNQLADLVGAGSPIVITDTNRRRLTFVNGVATTGSYTLAAGENGVDRPADNLFAVDGTQTVATFPDATRITATAYGDQVGRRLEPVYQPANAFDGNELTAWAVGGLYRPVGQSLTVDLRRPTPVSAAHILAVSSPGRRITRASLHFSDGSVVGVRVISGKADVTFPPRTTSRITVQIDAVAGLGAGRVGFSEITFPGIDLREVITLPTRMQRLASTTPKLATALAAGDIIYQFERARGFAPGEEEVALHRQFTAFGAHQDILTGTLEAGSLTRDAEFDALVGGSVGAFGTDVAGDLATARGALAVDGRLDTAWQAPAKVGEKLTIRFPSQAVGTVELAPLQDATHSAIRSVNIVIGGVSHSLNLTGPGGCHADTSSTGQATFVCPGISPLTLNPPVTASSLVIEITAIDPVVRLPGPLPIGISEVSFNNKANSAVPDNSAILDKNTCASFVMSLDGKPIPIAVNGTYGDLIAGKPLPFQSCAPLIDLAAGKHRLDAGSTIHVDDVRLAPTPHKPPAVPDPQSAAVTLDPTSTRLHVIATAPVWVTNGQSYDPGWRASTGATELGRPTSINGQNGWLLAKTGAYDVSFRYAPQRTYEAAVAVSLAFLVLCLATLLWRRRS